MSKRNILYLLCIHVFYIKSIKSEEWGGTYSFTVGKENFPTNFDFHFEMCFKFILLANLISEENFLFYNPIMLLFFDFSSFVSHQMNIFYSSVLYIHSLKHYYFQRNKRFKHIHFGENFIAYKFDFHF